MRTQGQITFRHTGNKPNDEKRQIAIVLYRSGLTLRECAKRMGVTYQAVHNLLIRSGEPLRGRGGNYGSHSRKKK